MQKALPIGNDQFRIVREKDYYYIDKTLLIKEFFRAEGYGFPDHKTEKIRENTKYDHAPGIF